MTDRQDAPQRPERPRAIVRRPRATVGERRTAPTEPIARARASYVAPARPAGPSRGLVALGGVIAFLFVFAGVSAFVLRSDMFTVQEIEIRGADRVLPEEILGRLSLSGESMFSADLAGAQRAAAAVPLVRSAKVSRSWPHGVIIEIEERTAWGAWLQGGVAYTIDQDGVVLGIIDPPAGSPVIKSSEPGSRHQP